MRFDLIKTVKDICNRPEFQAENGASYYIPGLNIEFNPRSDDSLHQSIYVEYNPTVVNQGKDEDEKDESFAMVDLASKAALTLVIEAFQEFFKEWYSQTHEIKVNHLIGVTVVTCNAGAISLMLQESDMGFYCFFTETLC